MTTLSEARRRVLWKRTLRGDDTLADDIGSIGAWVGPRTGPDKRSHSQKEAYVLRRYLVALRCVGTLDFPVEIHASAEDAQHAGYPDFVLRWNGRERGIEITEAGEETWQAALTAGDKRGEPTGPAGPPSTPATGAMIAEAIRKKLEKLQSGQYRGTPDCDLVIYDNTAWGGFLDKRELLNLVRMRNDLAGGFSQIHLVAGELVYLDILGEKYSIVDVSRTYEIDYANWVFDQVERMRHAALNGLDLVHIAEELEDLGKKERHTLRSYTQNLVLHLLKWQYQPRRRSSSWRVTINRTRRDVIELLSDSPSLNRFLDERLSAWYAGARADAAVETRMPLSAFPVECPYAIVQLLDVDFLPGTANGKKGGPR